MGKTVLITGGSGLVGSRLTQILLENDCQVKHLGRSRSSKNQVKSYIWDIQRGFVEKGAFENVNIVVHLAGAGVADKRWNTARKQKIIQSRLQTTKLLVSKLAEAECSCEAVISASAIGIYGTDTGDKWVDEDSPAGDGFLAGVTQLWEREILGFEQLKLRLVTLRIGLVLSDKGGALPKMVQPIKLNIGAALGSGRQFMSWIHIDDLCQIIRKAIEDSKLVGVYNAVAPSPVTNKEFTQTLAHQLQKKLWMPAVPGWALKIALGQMAQLVLGGNRVSSNRIHSSGFRFKYKKLLPALNAVLE